MRPHRKKMPRSYFAPATVRTLSSAHSRTEGGPPKSFALPGTNSLAVRSLGIQTQHVAPGQAVTPLLSGTFTRDRPTDLPGPAVCPCVSERISHKRPARSPAVQVLW